MSKKEKKKTFMMKGKRRNYYILVDEIMKRKKISKNRFANIKATLTFPNNKHFFLG